MRKFTIRDIACEKFLSCDNGDVILMDCVGDRLFLYPEKSHNGKPCKVEFNLRLSKKLANKLKYQTYDFTITPKMVEKTIKKLKTV